MVKSPPASAGDMGSVPGSGIPWSRKWQPVLVFLPEKSQGQRSLVATVQGIAKSQTRLKHIYTEEWLITSSMSLNSILLSL